jgi:hypothetical protein
MLTEGTPQFRALSPDSTAVRLMVQHALTYGHVHGSAALRVIPLGCNRGPADAARWCVMLVTEGVLQPDAWEPAGASHSQRTFSALQHGGRVPAPVSWDLSQKEFWRYFLTPHGRACCEAFGVRPIGK